MIAEAQLSHPDLVFQLLEGEQLPFADNTFDVVFNSFVLLDIDSKSKLVSIFKEMKRICKIGGVILSVTNSNFLFEKTWLTVKNNFSENNNLGSGSIAKLYLSDPGVYIQDYFWSEEDYLNVMKTSGFDIIDIFKPLGKPEEGYQWLDELQYPPYSIYACPL